MAIFDEAAQAVAAEAVPVREQAERRTLAQRVEALEARFAELGERVLDLGEGHGKLGALAADLMREVGR